MSPATVKLSGKTYKLFKRYSKKIDAAKTQQIMQKMKHLTRIIEHEGYYCLYYR